MTRSPHLRARRRVGRSAFWDLRSRLFDNRWMQRDRCKGGHRSWPVGGWRSHTRSRLPDGGVIHLPGHDLTPCPPLHEVERGNGRRRKWLFCEIWGPSVSSVDVEPWRNGHRARLSPGRLRVELRALYLASLGTSAVLAPLAGCAGAGLEAGRAESRRLRGAVLGSCCSSACPEPPGEGSAAG